MWSDDPEQLLCGLPDSTDALLEFAHALADDAREDEAISILEKACLRSPSPPLRKALARFYRQADQFEDCIGILRDILARSPSDVDSWLLIAETQILAGELSDARQSRARLKELGASRSDLLRLSVRLEKATDAETTESGSDGGTRQSGPPPLPGGPSKPESGPTAGTSPDGPETSESSSGSSESDSIYDGIFELFSSTDSASTIGDTESDGYVADSVDVDEIVFEDEPVEGDAVVSPDDPTQIIADAHGLRGDSSAEVSLLPEEAKRSPRETLLGRPTGPRSDVSEFTGGDLDAGAEHHPKADEREDLSAVSEEGFDALEEQPTETWDRSEAEDVVADEEPTTVFDEESNDRVSNGEDNWAEESRTVSRSVSRTDFESAQSSSSLGVWIVAALLVLILAAFGGGLGVLYSLGNNLESTLRQARSEQRPDTYQGYLDAVETLQGMSDVTSFAGRDVDEFMGRYELTTDRIESVRLEAMAELALVNAMIEFRHEHMDSRESGAHIRRARELELDGPRLMAAEAYRLMAGAKRQEAQALLDDARLEHARSRDLATASIELDLASGRPRAANHTAKLLRDSNRSWVYFDFLLGRVQLALGDRAAAETFDEILDNKSPTHLSARIEQSYAVRLAADKPDGERARKLVSSVLEDSDERASKLQKARAHAALGYILMAEGAFEKAREEFEKSVEMSPSRPSLHMHLVDYHLERGDPRDALEHIASAVKRSGQTDALLFRRARAQYELGRIVAAIETIETMSQPSYGSKLLEGKAHLDLDDPFRAAKAFEAARNLRDDPPVHVQSFHILARARSGRQMVDEQLSNLEALVEQSGEDPDVIRLRGLVVLEFAEAETGYRQQRDMFEQAVEMFEDALKERPEDPRIHYDLCRAHMRLGRAEEALAHCKRGQALAPEHRVGIRTFIELKIVQGRYDEATAMADALHEAYPKAPDVDYAVARVAVSSRELDMARERIAEWQEHRVSETHAARKVEGMLAFNAADYAAARGHFEVANQLKPHDAEAAVYYAWSAARTGSPAGEKVLRDRLSDPLWGARAWQALGDLRLEQQQWNHARENFAEALEKFRDTISPQWRLSESYAGLARAWAGLKGWDHYVTRQYVSRAGTRGDEASIPTQYLRGVYHLEKRRPDDEKGQEHLERVVAMDPYHCDAIERLVSLEDASNSDEEPSQIERLAQANCD